MTLSKTLDIVRSSEIGLELLKQHLLPFLYNGLTLATFS